MFKLIGIKGKKLLNSRGIVQLPIIIGLVIMAVALPLVANLVQKNTENRSKAGTNDGYYPAGTKCNYVNQCNTGLICWGWVWGTGNEGVCLIDTNKSCENDWDCGTKLCQTKVEGGGKVCLAYKPCISGSSCEEVGRTVAVGNDYCTEGSENNSRVWAGKSCFAPMTKRLSEQEKADALCISMGGTCVQGSSKNASCDSGRGKTGDTEGGCNYQPINTGYFCCMPKSTGTSTTEVTCNRCSNNNGCQMAHFTGLGTCDTIKSDSTTYTTDQSCGKKNGAEGGNDNSCTSTKEVSCNRCSLNNGCQMAHFTGLGTCDTIKPDSTTYTTDQSCGKKNGAEGGNDNSCTSTKEVSCDRCSLNNGCQMAHFTGLGTCDTIKPDSTTYTIDQSCGKKNGAEGGNDNSCTSTTEVPCNRCSLNNGCQMAHFTGLGTCDTIKPDSTTYTTDQSCPQISGGDNGKCTTSPPSTCTEKSRGDANCDGKVNELDYNIWVRESQGIDTTTKADFNSNGKVGDIADFTTWNSNLEK